MKDLALREQVINHMADVGKAAIDGGLDPWAAIERTFPGTPGDVIAAAWCKATDMEAEEWWQQVERTIDAEAVKSAVLRVSAGGRND